MKTIRTAVIAVAIALVVSSVSFAQTRYSGDFQIPQIGWQGAIGNEFRNRLYIGMSNWNLWSVNDSFSVGFYEKFDFGLGEYSAGWGFVTGAAVGLRVKDIVKFNVGSGFPIGFDFHDDNKDGVISIAGDDKVGIIGFAIDTQAKFLPKSIVSPLVGFQLRFMGPITTAVYAGASINWGRR